MKEAIITIPLTGFCEIDIEKAVKLWNCICVISCWLNEDYTLIEYSNKRRRYKLKVKINKDTALYLINELGLRKVDSEVFNACTYLWV